MSHLNKLPILLILVCAWRCGDDGGTADAEVDAGVDATPDAETTTFDHPARVLRIIDGDTIEVELHGAEWRIRLAGIDTPELGPPAEPYSEEARILTTQYATPTTIVGLEFDNEACGSIPVPSSCLDIYDRLLAYIRTTEGYDLNALLLANGLAQVYEYADFDRKESYLEVQSQAQAQSIGIWSQ